LSLERHHAMHINVLYFASIREQLGPRESLSWSLDESAPVTVGDLRAWLAARSPQHAQILSPERGLRAALDQSLCGLDAVLHDGAEVAFFPPVTGG
jgi:molybdopterin synthase sulfur carrier subunit